MFHQSFYSQSQQRPSFHNNHVPNHIFTPAHSSFNQHGSKPNRNSLNLNTSRDFEYFSMPSYGFNSIPNGSYPFYDLTRWRENMTKIQQQQQYRRTSAFHFQDKSTFYYMSDPIMTHDNRITIQLTKVHIGLNGDQQRVFVEQEFSDENEYKQFVQNLKSNFEKTFNNHKENTNEKKPNVVVIEEPDEEPKIYDQQVYNENIKSSFINREQYIPSYSTIHSNKSRTNKMKYQRPNHTRHHQPPPPPRFQKENHFHIPLNPNSNRKSNGSRAYIPPRFARVKEQQKSQPFRRTQQQPRTIAENLIFTNNKQHQICLDRTKSECRSKFPLFRNRNKFPENFDYRQRHSCPLIYPSTPLLYRNTPIQFRLFHFSHQNSNYF